MTRFLAAMAISGVMLASPAIAREQSAGPGADQDSKLGAPTTKPLDETERAALSPSRGMIELGRGVADKACAECHGMDGASREAGQPHLAGQRAVYLHRVMKAYQARERRNDDMYHATGFLNDEALLAVSAYYASLAPVLRSSADDTAGVEIAEQEGAGDPFADIRGAMKKCVKCHGDDGNASGSGMPNLTAQDPEYFLSSMQAYADGARSHKLMRKLVADLDEQTLSGMAVFYAVQEPRRKDKAVEGDAQKGAALAEPCATCHGDDGNASGADMPTLAGQDARYFAKAMNAYQSGARQHEKMFEAVEQLSEAEIADLAATSDLRVALYPHSGFYVATTADALRLTKKVDRQNLGATINLCHELMTDQGPKLDETIREVAPYLFVVSINGADVKQPGYSWDRLIQPLGRGDFDVCGFVGKLKAAGYRGPIGLQCYAVKGDKLENLRQSIKAWKEYRARLADGSGGK